MKFSELMQAPLQNLYGMRLLELVLRHLDVSRDDLVLDIGCGTGFASFILSKHAQGVTGIDISQPQIERLNRSPRPNNLEFRVIDAAKEPAEELIGNFDKCLSIDVLEHVEQPLALLNFAAKVLKKGGRLVLTCPLYRPEHGRTYLTRDNLNELLRSTSFRTNIRTYKQNTFGSLISSFYAGVETLLSPPKEADTFEETSCFEMMTKPRKIHSSYKLGIIFLFKITQNSYREDAFGRRALVIADKP